MPQVRTLRGGGEESGHQHAPDDDHHDHERSDNYEHVAYGTGHLLTGGSIDLGQGLDHSLATPLTQFHRPRGREPLVRPTCQGR
jgi:hypothetical protein